MAWGVVDVAADPHGEAGGVGVVVGAGAVASFEVWACPSTRTARSSHRPGRCLPGQQRRRDVGQRLARSFAMDGGGSRASLHCGSWSASGVQWLAVHGYGQA